MSTDDQSKVLELFGNSTWTKGTNWPKVIESQHCPFTNTKCFKVRKSQPEVSIGTCTIRYGKKAKDIIICPKRLLERRRVFTDCLHLLTLHEPGNDLHVVPEVSIPGGSVDYFLVSAKDDKVRDFVAIEFQTLDTTGTILAGTATAAETARATRPPGRCGIEKGFWHELENDCQDDPGTTSPQS